MKTIFLVVAILLNTEGDRTPRYHPAYQFDTIPECMDFVQGNNNGLVMGLMMKLREENDNSRIINIGCGEMSPEDADKIMNDYQQKPGVSA